MPKIVVWPVDDGGCGNYRFRYPAKALAAAGYDVTIDEHGPMVAWDVDWSEHEMAPPSANVIGLAEPYPADVVVIQRTARRTWAQLIPYLQASGTRVVVDIDDRLDRIPETNIAHRPLDPRNSTWRNHHWVDEACKAADIVTATTPALVERYGHGHGIVLPNLVPEHYLTTVVEKLPRTMGWTGSVATHPHDLEATRGGVARALAKTGWNFHVIGTGKGVASRLGLPGQPSATGWVPFADYPKHYAELEIAVVPLADSPFNHAKSCLKMIEAAALGVPVVASPNWDNVRMHQRGVGLLARSPNQWQRICHKLMASRAARLDLAACGREVMHRYTYERQADRWWDAWSRPAKRKAA